MFGRPTSSGSGNMGGAPSAARSVDDRRAFTREILLRNAWFSRQARHLSRRAAGRRSSSSGRENVWHSRRHRCYPRAAVSRQMWGNLDTAANVDDAVVASAYGHLRDNVGWPEEEARDRAQKEVRNDWGKGAVATFEAVTPV